MSYNAKIFNVMIASPSDVASERTITRDVIYEWNAVHSQSRGIALLPVAWESHSSPEMGGPQNIINQQVLNRCDLLVGIFWTRIGTPTENYQSGTVEEIEKHVDAGRPAMLYFSSSPVRPDSVDSEQYEDLKAFKKSCQNRSLYQDYEGQSDFKEKFYRHLQLKINQHELFTSVTAGAMEEGGEIKLSKTPMPNLSQEARILLKAASNDSHGNIVRMRYLGGSIIQASGKNFVPENDRREEAKWEAAIQELLVEDLLIDRGYKGEIFQITNKGYQIADMVEL